ncbi:AAA domain-containing protein [Pseudomonas shirazica]|uniref:AAA domain-containing protein n=1 Tax=Pseudomonas TaxID=286 RepID=UPI002A87761E|nr:AAA domain-containing protein [Pseudomonas putida]MDY4321605.1 AAA domain-containing protein [Pseudomonas putida]MDY4354899.1 AAA domain-containing protein [Pseudomonas putida]
MQGKQQDMEVLEGWRAFVEAAGVAKSRIKEADVHEHQQIKLNGKSLQENDQGYCFSLSAAQAATLKARFTKTDEQGAVQSDPLQLGFPLLRVIEGSKTFFIPLFRYSLPDTWHSEQSQPFTVPVKQGSDVAPNIDAFRLYLDIDVQELGAERHMMSIAAACMEDAQASFVALFSAFLRWIKKRLDDLNGSSAKGATASLELAFTAIICPEVNSDFNTQEQLKDYKLLLQRSDLQQFPLLRQYIEHRSAGADSTPSSPLRPPYGLFERQYPLGRGQMMALARVASGASLLAVQGAPGTGKTTLFKSLIASQIVERALACMEGDDRNLGLLVTSTAKKAVENVIDDLRGDACLADINWLYFQGGDRDQMTSELQRVSGLLRQLDTELHDQDKQEVLAARVTENKRLIDLGLNRFEALRKQLDVTTAPFKGASPEDYESQLRLLASEVSRRCLELGFSIEKGADITRQCADAIASIDAQRADNARAKKLLSGAYGKLVGAPFPQENYRDWLICSLSESLQHHFSGHPTSGLGLLLARWFGGKYRAARQHLHKVYPEDFSYYGLSGLSHEQLAKLARNRKELLAAADIDQVLKAEGWEQTEAESERAKALKQLSIDLTELTSRIGNLHRYEDAKRALQDEFPEGDWFEVLRLRFIAEQRALFECAIGYLWQELLRKKASVRQVLLLWSSMLSGKQDSGYYRWKDKLEEFYRLITLAYPVMASTLASTHKLAGYKLGDLNGFLPYQLSLVDEAGMVSVESLVPLLARSQRAIVVGDPLQIEPIRPLDKAAAEKLKARYFVSNTLYEAVSPMLVTAYHRAAGTLTGSVADIGNGIVLDEHRRCQPQIAALFMSIAEYSGVQVRTAAAAPRIQAACANMGGFNLMFYGVQGRRGLMPNTNQDEVDAIGLLLDKLEAAGYDLTQDVGIITPYSNQKNLLIKAYGERLKHRQALKIGSVHQFQGVGFEVIIYSPVIFQRTDRDAFQNSKPNLVNVAVSRAKQQFIVVGNQQRLLSAGKSLARMADMCAASFIVSMEHQSPSFEEASAGGVRHYFDCEHITAFESLVSSSRHSLKVVVPWIRQGSSPNHPPLNLLRAAQERGVAVTVYYGHDKANKANADDGDPGLILAYRRKLGTENVIRLPGGTHEKILLVDDQVATVGSWNWLSHSYYRYCTMPDWQSLSLRRETSVELRDPHLIAQFKARIAGMPISPN